MPRFQEFCPFQYGSIRKCIKIFCARSLAEDHFACLSVCSNHRKPGEGFVFFRSFILHAMMAKFLAILQKLRCSQSRKICRMSYGVKILVEISTQPAVWQQYLSRDVTIQSQYEPVRYYDCRRDQP